MNSYFTENYRWVPLNSQYFATARNVVPRSWTIYRLRFSGQDLSYLKLWTVERSHILR